MRTITVLSRQSIWNIACQEYGHVDGVEQLMLDNPDLISFEQSIAIGTKLLIDDTKVINQGVVDYFRKKGIKLNSAPKGGNISFTTGFSTGFKI